METAVTEWWKTHPPEFGSQLAAFSSRETITKGHPQLPGFPIMELNFVRREEEMSEALNYFKTHLPFSGEQIQRLYPMIFAGTSGVGKTRFGLEFAIACQKLNQSEEFVGKYFVVPFFISFNGYGDPIDSTLDPPMKNELDVSGALGAFCKRLLCRTVLGISVTLAHKIFASNLSSLYAHSTEDIFDAVHSRIRERNKDVFPSSMRVAILLQIDEFPMFVEEYRKNWNLLGHCANPIRMFNFEDVFGFPYFTQTAWISSTQHLSINNWKSIGLRPLSVDDMLGLLFQRRKEGKPPMSEEERFILRRTLALVNGITIAVAHSTVQYEACQPRVSIAYLCRLIWQLSKNRGNAFSDMMASANHQYSSRLLGILLTGESIDIPDTKEIDPNSFKKFIIEATSHGQVHPLPDASSSRLTVPYPFLISACRTLFSESGLSLPDPCSKEPNLFLEDSTANVIAVRLLMMSRLRKEDGSHWKVNDLFVGSDRTEPLDFGEGELSRVVHHDINQLWSKKQTEIVLDKVHLAACISQVGVHILAPNTFAFDLMVVFCNIIFLVQVKSGCSVKGEWSEVVRKGEMTLKAIDELFPKQSGQSNLATSMKWVPVLISLSPLGKEQRKSTDWILLDGERFSEFSPAERFRSGVSEKNLVQEEESL